MEMEFITISDFSVGVYSLSLSLYPKTACKAAGPLNPWMEDSWRVGTSGYPYRSRDLPTANNYTRNTKIAVPLVK